MKKRRYQKDSVLIKFILSFLLVLILPVFLFSFAYIKYDQKIYQDKLLKQEQDALELPLQELEQYIEEMKQIAVQTPLQSYVDQKDPMNYEKAHKLIQMLGRYRGTHSVLEEIAVYYEDYPEVIFTEKGTYSQEYYQKYMKSGKEVLLYQFVEMKESGEWITEDELADHGEDTVGFLQYIFKTPDKSCWVFTLSAKKLEELLKKNDAITILHDKNGIQLYPPQEELEKFRKDKSGVIELTDVSRSGALTIVRYVDSNQVFYEAHRMMKYFLFCMVLVLVFGVCLSTVLSFWNERPIWKLREFCESKVKDIPPMHNSIEMVRFAVNRMDEDMQTLSQQREKEYLLLQLLYGKQLNEEQAVLRLEHLKMFQNAEIYTLFLISTTDGEEGFEISRYVKAFENEKQLGCECYVMNCGCRNLIGIAGSHTKEAESLQNVFCRIMEEYPETKEEVTVYICEPCERLEEISRAYLAVLAESQKDSEEKVGQIVEVLKNPQQEFHYPELELNVLYEATVEQDTEKVVLIMEQLLESFPKQTEIDFICMALYCDIVRTYRRALNKTSLHSEELKMLLNIEKRPSPQSVQEIKAVIGAILRQSMECMKKQSISCVAVDEEINEIFRFIRENRESPDLCVKMVASQFDLSISNLSHRVKKATGRNVSDYITEMRMEYAHELLKDTDYNIQTIASMVGYTQASSFVSKFKKYYSVTPAEYRKKVKEDE